MSTYGANAQRTGGDYNDMSTFSYKIMIGLKVLLLCIQHDSGLAVNSRRMLCGSGIICVRYYDTKRLINASPGKYKPFRVSASTGLEGSALAGA